jgi:hypothetical protein
MSQTKVIMKAYRLLFTVLSLVAVQLFISSCSSSTSTTSKPGAWDRVGDFDGITRSNAVGFVLNGNAYLGMGYNYGNDQRLTDFYKYDATSDSWSQVSSFPGTARTNAVAFVLNGKAYVGTGNDGLNPLSDFWQYDPSVGTGGTWTRVADFGYSAANSTAAIARYGCVAFSAKGRAFVGTGTDKSLTGYKDIWEYDAKGNQWVKIQSIGGSKRWNAFVMTIGDFVYIGGGQDNGSYPTDFWKFDVTQVDSGNPWISLDALDQRDILNNGAAETEPKSRELAVTFTIGNFGYITAGSLGYALGDTWQYDPSTDNWIEYYSLNSEAQSRLGAVGFGLPIGTSGFGFITTGANSPASSATRLDDVWKFDPSGTEPNYK